MPPYNDWPEPSTVWICSSRRRTAPVRASTYVARRLGVPSCRTPPLRTSHASRGVPETASTTRRGAAPGRSPEIERVAGAGASARAEARSALSRGSVESASGAASVWLTPRQVACGPRWTTRSPPSTGTPWKLRSIRTCVAPSGSTMVRVARNACPSAARAAPGCSASALSADPARAGGRAASAVWTPRVPAASTAAAASPNVLRMKCLSCCSGERIAKTCRRPTSAGTRRHLQFLATHEVAEVWFVRPGRGSARARR